MSVSDYFLVLFEFRNRFQEKIVHRNLCRDWGKPAADSLPDPIFCHSWIWLYCLLFQFIMFFHRQYTAALECQQPGRQLQQPTFPVPLGQYQEYEYVQMKRFLACSHSTGSFPNCSDTCRDQGEGSACDTKGEKRPDYFSFFHITHAVSSLIHQQLQIFLLQFVLLAQYNEAIFSFSVLTFLILSLSTLVILLYSSFVACFCFRFKHLHCLCFSSSKSTLSGKLVLFWNLLFSHIKGCLDPSVSSLWRSHPALLGTLPLHGCFTEDFA